jgi:hypothetical protein
LGQGNFYGDLDHFQLQLSDLEQVKTLPEREKKLSEGERRLLAKVVFDMERSRIHAEHQDELGRLESEFENALDQARKADPQYSRHETLNNVPKKSLPSGERKGGVKRDGTR